MRPSTGATRPPVLMTMGDPAGIGPEIVLAAAARRAERWRDLVVVGDLGVMRAAAERLSRQVDWPVPPVCAWAGRRVADAVAVWQAGAPATTLPPLGQVSAQAGRMAAQAIELAARQVLAGAGRALVTAPIHKEALAAAGIGHPGHTEFLQALAAEYRGCRVDELPVRMMLSTPGLRTVLVSIHVALREAIETLSTDGVLQTVLITDRSLRIEGRRPRIAVAGLNPHAGEGGLFGREEIDVIAPAVAQARQRGVDVSGPYPPDTVFMRARQGAFDVVVAMYHDQGLIPVKLLGLAHGVNTTLGLPFVRTSPDHGTAFDLAGTGRAEPDSLLAAWDAALEMSVVD
jgi:4-hydroxythreonine-4-phosphate dehydrogenase